MTTIASLGGDLSLALLDIDYFKQVNDLCGHQTRDRVLKQFAGLWLDGKVTV